MRIYAEEKQLGVVLGSRTPVVVDGRSGFEPDILFVSEERRGIVRRLDLSHGPDVAVKIVSPSSKRRDYVDKRAGYERVGTREYWIVDPLREECQFYRLGDNGRFIEVTPEAGHPFESSALPGFRLDFSVLFADERPFSLALLNQMLSEG